MPLLEAEKMTDHSKKVRMVREVLDQVATKWTLMVLDVLEGAGDVRQSKLLKAIPGISQKMLTQTLRQLERDGLVTRKVKPTIPPQVSYKLTPQGESLSYATCAIWEWVEKNIKYVEDSRAGFDSRKKTPALP
ncbi:MAG TPA: helix-turn-helix domain-containing protein [bacterium]|nr:helix-turn-helix domain-containing protein [bacterium]